MVLQINHHKPTIAKQIYLLQQAAYAVTRQAGGSPKGYPGLQALQELYISGSLRRRPEGTRPPQ